MDLDLRSVWHYRELLYFLVWRNVKVRYKQTVIGAGWVILQPLLTMMIFTVVFSYLAKIPAHDLLYLTFANAALLPKIYLSQASYTSGNGLVGPPGVCSLCLSFCSWRS